MIYPGYFGQQGLTTDNISYRMNELMIELTEILYDQVRCCLRYKQQIPESAQRRSVRRVRSRKRRASSVSSSMSCRRCERCSHPTSRRH